MGFPETRDVAAGAYGRAVHDGGERTFLVEVYVPRLDAATAAAITSRCRTAVRDLKEEGVSLRWLQSFSLIDEDTYLCIVAARDRQHIGRLSGLAGLKHSHVVEVVAIDAAPTEPR